MKVISALIVCVCAYVLSTESSDASSAKKTNHDVVMSDVIQPNWWVGSWVSQEMDQCGNRLVVLLYLIKENKFLKHLVSKDHSTRDIWGSYQIESLPKKGEGREDVTYESFEPKEIETRLAAAATYDKFARKFYKYAESGKVMSKSHPHNGRIDTVVGDVTLNVEGKFPPDYGVGQSQEYIFRTQGPGYMRISGPGANYALARRYSDHIVYSKDK